MSHSIISFTNTFAYFIFMLYIEVDIQYILMLVRSLTLYIHFHVLLSGYQVHCINNDTLEFGDPFSMTVRVSI